MARPARFELTTSAFGGQFPRFAVGCGGLRVVDKCLVLRCCSMNISADARSGLRQAGSYVVAKPKQGTKDGSAGTDWIASGTRAAVRPDALGFIASWFWRTSAAR